MTIKINTTRTKQYQPFIKWAGGKRGILSQLMDKFPTNFENYHEPFLGGGAVFFELYSRGLLENKKVYLSDINFELINTYNVVKNNSNELIKNLEIFKKKHSKEFYYKTRKLDRQESFKKLSNIQKAVRFIYLNKTCFNGLYRVNKKGQFNTPIGSYKNPNIADYDTILNASEALQDAIILNKPFDEVVKNTNTNDLVYFDPPYYPLNATSNFTAYDSNCFLDDEQFELFEVFDLLSDKNVKVLHSNSDTKFIKNLYNSYDIHTVSANRFINSNSRGRGKINELLIRNK